jgi:hypothetical protein
MPATQVAGILIPVPDTRQRSPRAQYPTFGFWARLLAKIGAAVHFLDVGGIPVADAKGLETVLRGIKEKARNDDALLAEAMRILDLFYSAYAQARPE